MTTDREAQEDEILALTSIYDDDSFSSSLDDTTGVTSGSFSALLSIPKPFIVRFRNKLNHENPSTEEHNIESLPPLMLSFELPVDYPSQSPPSFNLTCKWLSLRQLSRACCHLDELWRSNCGEVILFLWTSFLQDELFDFLQITSPLDLTEVVPHRIVPSDSLRQSSESDNDDLDDEEDDPLDSRAFQDIACQTFLMPAVLEHDQLQREAKFNSTMFSCAVCLVEKPGKVCMQFVQCGHTFCRECMKNFFEVLIKDGNVKGLLCPNCPADTDSHAHPAQVKDLVSASVFQRYDRLLLQTAMDTMSDVMYCPRAMCGCPVLVDAAPPDSVTVMGSCAHCHFVFCVFCKGTYHGVSPCKIKSEEVKRLREEYLACDEKGKKSMEKRYGRVVIRKVIEDSFTEEWLQEYSKRCPNCKTHIQKIDGCNKMTCSKCNCFFCWICGCVLSRANPYQHFSDTRSGCFNQLFHGAMVDDDPFLQEEDFLDDDEDEDGLLV
ncbi:hypothetical protein CAPTEDRAFT_154469 [Capitella teleta]|uniref:RBR-type E3 ubiquitin transferase n=1 Tax=Capitella teleta TaxID=283909 RepID=R7VCJ9_CAPTE|nr:hypothetical protein CAPTEDRAFT_154469 [Capitella teleta]|eukprot:ELU14036.1 hypothetical protein CAPTEDRAFT_154469 [Capitella teleta]